MDKERAKDVIHLLEKLKEFSEVTKITSTFIPAFNEKSIFRNGIRYLHGNFRLGGTKSGRLSSNNPNLQQIPSTGTKYAKTIKKCFRAPFSWIMVGADFSSLEDRISALQTKDTNKLKVYTDGFDGHSLRAYAYFKNQMPDIDPNDVNSINSIGSKYPKLRQDSKMPTFALTYMGTYKTLMKNGGFTENQAKKIEAEYHRLYKESDVWVREKLLEASQRGYAELAFGLRLRTPILAQVLVQSVTGMPWEAHAELKTVGNALTQSYGLLNTRAVNAFMDRVWKSEYRYDILPIAQIHDASYYIIRNKLSCLKFVNDNLIDCMRWCELPEIQHDKVKLEAELEVYWPSWAKGYKIPNDLTKDELRTHLKTLELI